MIFILIQGFRDTSIYNGRLIHFYKRAQILVADVWGAYKQPKDPNHPCFFHDIHELTMFADYRIPQILRQIGILEYSPELAVAVDSMQEIPFGSKQEVEIRACTVIAVEMLHRELVGGCNISNDGKSSAEGGSTSVGWSGRPVLELDWLLWQWGEERCRDVDMPPHHRTRTIYY